MADFDESGNLLDQTAGLGLASAPGTQLLMPSFPEEPTGQFGGPTGLGLASAQPSPTQSDKDFLESLPTAQRIGLALQAFGAAVNGQPSPIESLLKRKRQEERDARTDLVQNTGILSKALEDAKKFDPQSIQGKAVLNAYKRLLPPEFAVALDAIGTDQEDTARSLAALVSDPDVQATLVKTCGRDRACWQKQVNDKDWLAMQYQTVDMKRLQTALPKLRAFKDQVIDKGGLGVARDKDGKISLSWPELVEGNAKLRLFSDAEMDTFRRNPDFLIPYGIKTTKALSAGEVEAAKIAERPEKEGKFKVGDTRREFDPQGNERQMTVVSIDAKGNPVFKETGRRAKPAKVLSVAQERSDQDVLNAREKLEAMKPEEIEKKSKRLIPASPGSRSTVDNPDFDPEIDRLKRTAGRALFGDVQAKREAGKGKEKPAQIESSKAKQLSAEEKFKISWEKTKKIHNLTDAELEKRLGRKRPAK